MVRLACILLAALCLAAQEPKQNEPSIEQELAALIAKTNALETFHAIYDIESTGELPRVSLEVVYRAPDLGCVRVITPDITVELWDVGDSTYVGYVTENMQEWSRASLPERAAGSKELDELFPADGELAPGLIFHATMNLDSDASQPAFNIQMQGPRDRTHALSWLKEMQDQPSDVSRGDVSSADDALVWTFANGRCLVSRTTGFVQSVEYDTEEPYSVRLRELQCDETLAPSLVTLPAEAEDADEDPELLSGREQLYTTEYVRWTGFLRVEKQIASEKLPWNEHVQSDWRTFLSALHREPILQYFSSMIDHLHVAIDEVVTWTHAQRVKDDSAEHLADLKQRIARLRRGWGEGIDQVEGSYADFQPPIADGGVEPRQELFDIEHEVVAQLYDELVRQPILTLLDEKFAAALEK